MSWFEEQLETRRRLDGEEIEDAYAHLAASVMGASGAPRFTLDDAAAADTAIEAVLAYYGTKPGKVPEEIRDPFERVAYAIRPTGVMRRAVKLTGSWWKDATGAYLGQLKGYGPIAIIPIGFKGYGYIDPETRRKVRISAKTADRIEPNALCFYRPLPQGELTIHDVFAFMLKSLSLADYVSLAAAALVSMLIGMFPAVANSLLFDRIIPAGTPALILPIAALLISMTLAKALIQITSAFINERLQTKLAVQMQAATFARVLMLPPSFFKNYASGDLATRTMAMTSLVQFLSDTIATSGIASVFSLAYIGQVAAFAPSLVLPSLVIIGLQVLSLVLITHTTMAYNHEQMEANAHVSGILVALLHGIQKIKLSGAEKRAFSQWAKAFAVESEATYNRPVLLLAGPNLSALIPTIGSIVIYGIAAASGVSVADFMAYSVAFGSVSGAILTLGQSVALISNIRPLLELTEPIMKTAPEVQTNQKQLTSISGSIEISNLSFRYTDHGPLVLDNLSLRIRPGEYVAIVGRTGCGKSTLMRLLLGFEEPTKGAIYYAGQDLATVDVRSLRRAMGVVMQDGSILQGDLFTNIIIANPQATLDDAWEAAELAGIADDIRKLPMGMHTLVSEGSGGLSGGQRQRIMIARAICGKPKVLMLDEATSALDNVTQRHVSKALAGLKCTRVVIAHRLSTIKEADRIIMLEGGHIVEDGTYDQLVARGGKFADLVNRQRLEGE